jgi:hypothetical protein
MKNWRGKAPATGDRRRGQLVVALVRSAASGERRVHEHDDRSLYAA